MDSIDSDQQNLDNITDSSNGILITPDQMKPLNDPECSHEWEIDHDEENDNFYGMKCKHCIVGHLVRKS